GYPARHAPQGPPPYPPRPGSGRGPVGAGRLGGPPGEAGALLGPGDGVPLVRGPARHPAPPPRPPDAVRPREVQAADRAPQPAGAVELVLAALLVLAPAEVRQDLVPAPPARAHLRPAVVVRRLSAHVEHAVDRARPAEHLALGPLVPPPARALVDLGLVEPVDLGIVERLAEADRRVDHHVREELAGLLERPVVAPGLEQNDFVLAALGQPCRQHAACAARADDDVVRIEICGHLPLLSIPTRARFVRFACGAR